MTNSPMTDPAAAGVVGPDAPRSGWRWAPYWILAFVALSPGPGIAEGVLVLGALAELIKLLMHRFRGGTELRGGPAGALRCQLFFASRRHQLPSCFYRVTARESFSTSAKVP